MISLKLTTTGVILALKNLGIWLASWSIAQVKADWTQFTYAFVVYALISIPTDLFLGNHLSEKAIGAKKEKKE